MFCYFGIIIVDCCLFFHVYSVEYNILRPSFGPIKSADVVEECYFYVNSFYLRGDFSNLIFISSLLFHLMWMHSLSAPYMWGIYSYTYVAMQQRHFYLSRTRQVTEVLKDTPVMSQLCKCFYWFRTQKCFLHKQVFMLRLLEALPVYNFYSGHFLIILAERCKQVLNRGRR